jgi:hypothetical protein
MNALLNLLAVLLTVTAVDATDDSYIDPQPVNTSMCLAAVEGLPLRVFGFKYDSKQGRRQVGVVGPELRTLMPDSVKIVPSQPFPNPLKTGPKIIKVKNYHHVDHNVLFMHGLGATQEIARLHRAQAELVAELRNESEFAAARGARREAEYARGRGRLAAFGEGGELAGSEGLRVDEAGVLHAARIGAFAAAGTADFGNHTLQGARIRGGSAAGLARLSTLGGVTVGGRLDVRSDAHISGSLTALGLVSGAGPYHDISDRRLKTDVRPIVGARALLSRLRGVTYSWRRGAARGGLLRAEEAAQAAAGDAAGADGGGGSEARPAPDAQQIVGFIAQEVEAVVPSAVSTRAADGVKAVATSRLVPLLVEGVNEMAAAWERERGELHARLTSIERDNAALRAELRANRELAERLLAVMGRTDTLGHA